MRYYYTLLFVLICIISNAQPKHLLHKSYAGRYPFIDSMINYTSQQVDYEIAAKKYYELEEWAEDNNDIELAYSFDIARLRQSGFDFNTKNIQHYEQLIDEALENDMPYIAADIYCYLAEKLWGASENNKAFTYALKGYELYKNTSLDDYPARIHHQTQLINTYYNFGDISKTKYYILDISKHVKGDPYIALGPSMYNTLALIYNAEDQYDSARRILYKIYDQESTNRKYALAAMAAGNIGAAYNKEQQTDSAIYWFKKEAEIAEKNVPGKLRKNLANSAIALADIYYQKGDDATALHYTDKAFNYLSGVQRNHTYKIRRDLYEVQARILAAQGKIQDAYNSIDSYAHMTDSVVVYYNKAEILHAEQKINNIHYEMQLAELQHARKTSVLVRNAIIGLILLLSVIIILIINRRRLKEKQKQEKALIELYNAKKQLSQFTRNLQEKNRQIEEISGEIEKFRNEQNDAFLNDTILQLQRSTILTDEEWDEFRMLFEQVHSGFITRLKEKHPDITPAETRYLVLARLNLNNKEMANILGIGTNAVRNIKFRLRRKFDLPDDDTFDDMIKNI